MGRSRKHAVLALVLGAGSGCVGDSDAELGEPTTWDQARIEAFEARAPELLQHHSVPGIAVALIEDANGRVSRLDICRREGDVASPLARTARYEIYVRNGADGATPSEANVVLAARALGDVIRQNEAGTEVALISKHRYWRAG